MKYRKLVREFLSHRSNQNNAQVAVALVAGLAAGAVISILFAPDKGSSIRKGIANKTRNLGEGVWNSFASIKNSLMGNVEIEENDKPEVPHFTHKVTKNASLIVKI